MKNAAVKAMMVEQYNLQESEIDVHFLGVIKDEEGHTVYEFAIEIEREDLGELDTFTFRSCCIFDGKIAV